MQHRCSSRLVEILESKVAREGRIVSIVGLAREGAWNPSDVSEAEKASSTMFLLQMVIKIVQVLGLGDRNLR